MLAIGAVAVPPSGSMRTHEPSPTRWPLTKSVVMMVWALAALAIKATRGRRPGFIVWMIYMMCVCVYMRLCMEFYMEQKELGMTMLVKVCLYICRYVREGKTVR